MDANGANTVEPACQMLLRSQGPVDQLDTTQLSPAGSYVRSYNHNGQPNVNASYHTVSLKIKERRRELVVIIVAVLGNDPRYWFAPSLRPLHLPIRPLDWSTTLLQQLCVFAQSLPCDLRNTMVDHRLSVAHQTMLTEASPSAGSDKPAKCDDTHQGDEQSFSGKEHEQLCQARARNLDLLNQIHALDDEVFGCNLQKGFDDLRISELEEELKAKALELSECNQELERSRESNAWADHNLVLAMRLQASNDQVQIVLSGHQRALGFFS